MITNPYPDIQPRYAAYCLHNRMHPADMRLHDIRKWPGGPMCGYITWIGRRLAEFRFVSPDAFIGSHLANQDAFTEFLFAGVKR